MSKDGGMYVYQCGGSQHLTSDTILEASWVIAFGTRTVCFTDMTRRRSMTS